MVFAGIERCTSVSNFNDVADRCKGIRKERGTDTIEELEGHTHRYSVGRHVHYFWNFTRSVSDCDSTRQLEVTAQGHGVTDASASTRSMAAALTV